MSRDLSQFFRLHLTTIDSSLAIRLLLIGIFGLSLRPVSQAQNSDPNNDTGIHPYETYDGAREHINLGTGNVFVSVPLLTLPGRNGHNYSVGLISNSQTWSSGSAGGWASPGLGMVLTRTGAVSLHPNGTVNPAPGIQCLGGYTFSDEKGGVHTYSNMQSDCIWVGGGPNQGMRYPQYDVLTGYDDRGEGIGPDLSACKLNMPNGDWFPLESDSGGCPLVGILGQSVASLGVLHDSNGNEITVGALPQSCSSCGGADLFPSGTDTDTLGHAITYGSNSIQYKDSNGAARTITLSVQSLTLSCALAYTVNNTQPHGTYKVITSAVLPDGLTYIFHYDQCGTLDKIVYPSGGYTRYVFDYSHYARFLGSQPLHAGVLTDIELTKRYVCRAASVSPGATSTGEIQGQAAGSTCPTGVAEDLSTYTPTVNSTICNNSANTVVDALGNQIVYQFTNYTNCQVTVAESQRQIYQGTSTLLRTVQTTYLAGAGSAIYPNTITTILPNGLQSEIKYPSYARLDLPNEKDEYGWGQGAPGALARVTKYTWPCNRTKGSEIVYDGSNNQIAKTTYEMDNYTSAISSSGAVQHDPNYGSSFTNRCNVTAVNVWRNTDGATLTTRYQYDDAGNRVSATAPSNSPFDTLTRTTSYSYTDSWANTTCTPAGGNGAAFVTQITDPAGLVTKSSYNSCTGTVASTTDPNNQVTIFSYDLMDRRTLTTLPDTGQTSTCYSEVSGSSCYSNAYPLKVVATQKITSSINKVSTTVLDGLARVTQTQLNSDPDCTASGGTKVDTTYDGAEHKSTVTNPYCTNGDSSYGVTTYQYDGADRVTKVIPPDGTAATNNVVTTYDIAGTGPSNCTLVIDQVGNQRTSCSDALGRLVEVDEPGAAGTSPTPGSGSVTITGAETSQNVSATAGSGWVTLSGGTSSCYTYTDPGGGTHEVPDVGSVSITVAGIKVTATWGGTCSGSAETVYVDGSSGGNLSSSLASQLTSSSANVTATVSSCNSNKTVCTISITAKTTGSNTNYSLLAVSTPDTQAQDPMCPSQGCMNMVSPAQSGNNLTGGQDAGSKWDTGTVTVTVNGAAAQHTYGQTDTVLTIAQDIANQLASQVTPSLSSSCSAPSSTTCTISMIANLTGTGSNYQFSTAVQDTAGFSPSFSTSPANSTFTGGSNGTPAVPLVTQYQYNVLNNLLCVEQHGGVSGTGCSGSPANDYQSPWRVRRFSYNSLSQLLNSSNPEIADVNTGQFCTVSYTYDNVGNLYQKISPLPNQPMCTATVTKTMSYDIDNRLIKETYSDGTPTVRFGYDGATLSGCTMTPPVDTDSYPKGRRTSMCDGSGGTTWTHDKLGRTLQERRKIGVPVVKAANYSYNLDGSLASWNATPMKNLFFTYKGAGRATKLVDTGDSINFVTNATYAPFGGLKSANYGAAITIANDYNPRMQPLLISAVGASTIMSLCYDFHSGANLSSGPCSFAASTAGNNGNVWQIVNNRDANRTQNFNYDVLNRITTGYSSGPNWGETFTIDAWGNLYNRGPVSGKTLHEPLSQSAGYQNRLSGYSYDAAGNLTNNGGVTYTYDAENRLVWTSGYRYMYDGSGQRVEKCIAGTSTTVCPTSGTTGTLYWRDLGGETLEETDLGGTPQEEYIYFNGRRMARRDLSSTGATVAVHYYLSDHLGTHSIVTDQNGTMPPQEESDFYPYGGEIPITTGDPNHYKFTGKERDSESGLDNFGARFDASSLARFMSPDPLLGHPVDPQTLNKYAYVRNSPTVLTDPSGLDSVNPGAENEGPWAGAEWCTGVRAEEDARKPAEEAIADLFTAGAQNTYKSKDAAAKAAGQDMRKRENGYKWEYGARIHKDGKNYSYGPVVTDKDPKGVNLPDVQKNDVGDIHTHNNRTGENPEVMGQSDQQGTVRDMDAVRKMNPGAKQDYDSYVLTPKGDLIKFTPDTSGPAGWGEPRVIDHGIAPDPNPQQ